MNFDAFRLCLIGVATSLLAACGGSSSTAPTLSAPQDGKVALLLSDASSEDWATIGVKVLSVALVPQGGGANVTVYTAPAVVPVINLAQLDQLGELIGNASVPAGSYSGAQLTLSANPGDLLLIAAADPEAGFAAAPGATIPSNQIDIQHTQGTAPNMTVPIPVSFATPLVVNASQNNQLDLEFDLGHPAFLIGHTPVATGTTIWAVNFDGPVRRHSLNDIASLVLRHLYGAVTAIATDNSAITVTKEYPTEPVVNPETAVATTQSLQILADATNGTIFYDLDAKTRTVIKDFSSAGSLVGKSVRVAARYQQNGTLVAVRIWAGSQFNSVWFSPEGHVLHVDATNDIVTVQNEMGIGVPLVIDANTQFFVRTPQNPAADSTPIATGTAFIANQDLVRGFKVHASVVDPLATPLVAQSIDIETAVYGGTISAPDAAGFTYTRNFRTAGDDYVHMLDYISAATANGKDAAGNPIDGYKWWNFAFPTTVDSGANAIGDFIAATNGTVDFGGSAGAVATRGVSRAIWNDPANPDNWSAAATVLLPSVLPLGTVANGLVNNAFTMTVAGGMTAATIDISTTSGGATLVYQVDRSNGVVTISPVDITTNAGLMNLANGLAVGARVRVYGLPQPDGTVKAYVLTYFTGTLPAA